MVIDPITLYKLMVLKMLKKVNFPLSNSQLSDFFLERDYTNYFTLQQVIGELVDTKLISVETERNTSRYQITKEGEEALYFFGNNLSDALVADIDDFLKDNKYELRNKNGITADFYKNSYQEYIVQCRVKEGTTSLIELNLSVPSQEQAELICDQWEEKSEEVYNYIVQHLMKKEK
ncbi:MAG: DUF4364 family protein [Lachnospiraceae bacterium]